MNLDRRQLTPAKIDVVVLVVGLEVERELISVSLPKTGSGIGVPRQEDSGNFIANQADGFKVMGLLNGVIVLHDESYTTFHISLLLVGTKR